MIKIPVPCDADWQKMTPESTGKFCSSCEKVVVDFSKMSDCEIKDYFIAHAAQKTCGRFLTTQVERKLQIHTKNYFALFLGKLPKPSIVQSAVFLVVSSFFWLSSCVKKQTTLGELQYKDPDYNKGLMGDTIIMNEPEDTIPVSVSEDTIQQLQGEVTPPRMHMGKVYIVDTISQRIKKRR